MKVLRSILISAASVDAQCGPIETSSFWSDGHSVGDCTDGNNINSQCAIQCNPPYVSFNPSKPYDSWNVMCRRPANPEWVTSKFSNREDHNCYYCPTQTQQTKPRGSKILSTVNDASGTRIGMELKVTFDQSYFASPNECTNFLFGLRSPVPFPDDATFSSMGGAEATFISNDRTLVTFQPSAGFESIHHPFWHADHHDGTRIYIAGSDLGALRTGQYNIKTVVACSDPSSSTTFNDLSCSVTPTESGIALTTTLNDCPETTPVVTTPGTPSIQTTTAASTTTTQTTTTTSTPPPTTTTTTPQVSTTTSTPASTTTPQASTTTPPTTTTTQQTTTTTVPISTTTPTQSTATVASGCHSLVHTHGDSWPAGDNFEHQGSATLTYNGNLNDGTWHIDFIFNDPVSAFQNWDGDAAVMVDNAGYHWRIQGWPNAPGQDFQFSYIATHTVQGGTTPSVSLCVGDATPTSPTTPVSTTTTSTTTTTVTVGDNCGQMVHSNNDAWSLGSDYQYQGQVSLVHTQPLVGNTWYLDLLFADPVSAIEAYKGTPVMQDTDGLHWRITGYDDQTYASSPTSLTFLATTTSQGGTDATAILCNNNSGGGSNGGGSSGVSTTTPSGPTTTTTTGTTQSTTTPTPCVGDECGFWGQEPAAVQTCSSPFGVRAPNPVQTSLNFPNGNSATDYEKLLHMSILFYEAQRSGPLPSDNRIPWRWHSTMNDGCDFNVDLTGGWFDAGDHVKFNLPMAFSVTTLAWGIVNFEQGYLQAGELQNALDSIKWATDYFIKCNKLSESSELYVQTGEGHRDHTFWGRAEEYPDNFRPDSYKLGIFISPSNPGSDVAGEMAAALAASSIAYRRFGATALADEALANAQEIFTFATTHEGRYDTDGNIPVTGFYQSFSGYNDELIWAAAWIAKATGNADDIQRARDFYDSKGGAGYWYWSWDNKLLGVQVLMYELTGDSSYATTARGHIDNVIASENRVGDLIYFHSWAAIRHSLNFSFLLAQATQSGMGSYMSTAQQQLNYALGQNSDQQCYIVGYDEVSGASVNCPQNPHHRNSQCPAQGACNEQDPNPNTWKLYGAVVGGPSEDGVFVDDRTRYELTEVATDYNSGYQGLLAALIQGVGQ